MSGRMLADEVRRTEVATAVAALLDRMSRVDTVPDDAIFVASALPADLRSARAAYAELAWALGITDGADPASFPVQVATVELLGDEAFARIVPHPGDGSYYTLRVHRQGGRWLLRSWFFTSAADGH
jgi:hypothetical protein